MILIDVNLLIYAYDNSSAFHDAAAKWLEDTLSRESPVGLAWDTVHAFLRISTNPRLFDRPLNSSAAISSVEEWLRSPNVQVIAPGPKYWSIFSGLLRQTQIRGPRVTDAQLAALAIEHDATLCTADRDFRRFPGLRVENPLAGHPT